MAPGREVITLNRLRIARDGYIVISVVFYIAGILYMLLPSVSTMAVCICSGIILTAYGIVKILGYFSNDLYCLAFQYDLACGLLLIVVGLIVLGCNERFQSYLSPGLGLLILLDALLKIQTSKDARRFGLETWKQILIGSICVGIFGVLIIVKPFPQIQSVHVVNGCGLLAEGLLNHMTVLSTVKIVKANCKGGEHHGCISND